MVESGRSSKYLSLAVVFALGIGLGWAGATHRAIDENRTRDGAGFEDVRKRLDEETMRLLDLSEEQRRVFLAAKQESLVAMNRLFGNFLPDVENILAQADQKIRPMLSPRQLAVYDRMEREHRNQLPGSPAAGRD